MQDTWLAWIGIALASLCGCASTQSAQTAASDSTAALKSAAPPATPEGAGSDPDGDNTRATAKEGKPNQAITDSLNPAKGDSIDFYSFMLGGAPGPLTVDLHWDDESAELNLEVFNPFGERIAQPKGQFDGPQRRVVAEIPEAGKYHVKISSVKGGSDYTFRAKWAGSTDGATTAVSPAPDSAPTAAAAPPAAVPIEDAMHPRAKIIQSYRGDDGLLVLYIDKGSAANIKPGMTGVILEGAEGDKPLDGGSFRITKVVDSTKSIGKATLTKVGKNNRCVINLIR